MSEVQVVDAQSRIGMDLGALDLAVGFTGELRTE